MNIYKNLKILIILFCVAVVISSCKKDEDDPTPTQVTLTKLLKSWTAGEVTRDGLDVTVDYTNFTLTFANETFEVTNGDLAWPDASGSWQFTNDTATEIVRLTDDVIINLEFNTSGTILTLSFTIAQSDYIGGKTDALEGDYIFILNN